MKDPGGVVRRLSLFNYEVFHRAGEDLIDADFLSLLETLRDATASEAEDAEPREVTYPLPFP